MEKTWASGAIELIKHADTHIQQKSAFDKRIAFISIDNSVEVAIRTFLSLPVSLSRCNVKRSELDEARNSFPKLLELLQSQVPQKVSDVNIADIEHYHRIRNTLYHDGTGLSVDEEYLRAYRVIAQILLEKLFGVVLKYPPADEISLETLILKWEHLESLVDIRFADKGIDRDDLWQFAVEAGVMSMNDMDFLTKIRIERFRIIQSNTALDKVDLEYWIKKTGELIDRLSSLRKDVE